MVTGLSFRFGCELKCGYDDADFLFNGATKAVMRKNKTIIGSWHQSNEKEFLNHQRCRWCSEQGKSGRENSVNPFSLLLLGMCVKSFIRKWSKTHYSGPESAPR